MYFRFHPISIPTESPTDINIELFDSLIKGIFPKSEHLSEGIFRLLGNRFRNPFPTVLQYSTVRLTCSHYSNKTTLPL